ncbi:MAG: hypothetical protein JW725_03375 [Candidatus Babeliaceae bacterium]|nr:hypothetical protein [Candidatus Babeliaceae bacterium]
MSFMAYMAEYNRYMQILGIAVVFGVAFLFSNNKRRVNYGLIVKALVTQFILAWFMLKTTIGSSIMQAIANAVAQLYVASQAGISFVFGALGVNQPPWGAVFALQVLPFIIFFGAFMALLFHIGIIQWCVRLVALVVRPVFGTSGAETLCGIANSFLGQTEAPLLVRNYLERMTRSEIFFIMVGGMGHISGSLLAIYHSQGVPIQHLLSASIMALPATILVAKTMCPEVEQPETAGSAIPNMEAKTTNMLDAISSGTGDGLKLALNVGAMLVAFIALIATVNMLIGWVVGQVNSGPWQVFSLPNFTLESLFGYLLSPVGWLLGLTGPDALAAGKLIGLKVVGNEFIAYLEMVKTAFSDDRAIVILTYALCGFSNFSSIGIQIGGIGSLAPSKRQLLSEFGFRAVLGGVLVNLLTAMVAGLLI